MIAKENYLLLKKYHAYLVKARRHSGATLKTYEAYDNLLLEWAGERPFHRAPDFEKSFPDFLAEGRDQHGKPYSRSYEKGACGYARRFFSWSRDHIKDCRGYTGGWIESIFPLSRPGESNSIQCYTIEEVTRACAYETDSLRIQRTQAALAFLLLTGMRIAAFLTLPISNVDITARTVKQIPADGVCTKYNKAAITTIFSISALIDVISRWDHFVRASCPENTTWFARLDVNGNLDPKPVIPMTRENTDTLKAKARSDYPNFRKDLQELCKLTGIPYKPPHKARYGHIHLGMSKAKTFEERKAVSENVMHRSVSVTDEVYSRLDSSVANAILSTFDFENNGSQVNVNTATLAADMHDVKTLLLAMANQLSAGK